MAGVQPWSFSADERSEFGTGRVWCWAVEAVSSVAGGHQVAADGGAVPPPCRSAAHFSALSAGLESLQGSDAEAQR